jgi:glycosyltransferase involved in cell wall biosynthesis
VRILHAIQELEVGGAERVVAALAAGARRRGHDVALAAVPGRLSRELDLPFFELPLLERRAVRVAPAAWRLGRVLATWSPDLVHAHNPGMAVVTGLATRRGRRPAALASVHGMPEKDYPRAARILRWSGLPVVACGPGVAAALAEHGYAVRTTIPNAVGPPPPAASRAELGREWRIGGEQRLVLTVGRLAEAKNHAAAVRALACVPEAVLVLVGEGPLRPRLEAEAAAAGVGDRVVFAGFRSDARALMGAADAVLLPSRSEGLPLVALEAAAAGAPVVASAVRGVRELLTDGRDALLVPPDDPPALGDALARVLREDGLAERLSEGGRRLARENSEERMVAGYLELYAALA